MFNSVLERFIAGSSYKICFNYCFHGSSIVYHFLPARNQTQRLCKDCEGWRLGHDLVTWPPVAQGRDLCVLVEVAGTKLNQEHQEPW